MVPALSPTPAEPTLYEVLSLTPKQLEGQASATQQKTIKQAYRKALLRHHPDKKPPGSPIPSTSSSHKDTQSKPSVKSSSSAPKSQSTYTIDQIQDAYNVLSDARQRREYDRQLLLNPSSSTSPSQTHPASTRFQTGIETVDLDDLDFDEQTGLYYGSCRCGNDRGFQFTEEQLAEHEDDLVLTVQCQDCSLWMRVLFDEAEESEEEQQQPQQQQHPPSAPAHPAQPSEPTVRTGAHSISTSGKSWNFNLSFDWGISLSSPAAPTMATTTTSSPPGANQRDRH